MAKEEIQFIDNWLQFAGIQYIDVRFELVDHLVTEFEQQENGENLKEFIQARLEWCKRAAKKREKTMHWGIQKSLFKRFLAVCYTPKYVILLAAFTTIFLTFSEQLSNKTLRFLLLVPVITSLLVFIFFVVKNRFSRKEQEEVLAINKLFTLSAFPQIFLSLLAFPETLKLNLWLLAPALFIMTLMNIAATIEYHHLYKKIYKTHMFLKNSRA